MKNTRMTVIVILLICVPLLCLGVCSIYIYKLVNNQNNSQPVDNITINTEATEADKPAGPEMFYYAGLTDMEIATGESRFFQNDPENVETGAYEEFVISDANGKELYRTGLLPVGKGVDVTFSDFLPVGTTEVVVLQQPYKVVDATRPLVGSNITPLYFIDQTINITIK